MDYDQNLRDFKNKLRLKLGTKARDILYSN